jgi:hypothetical protein
MRLLELLCIDYTCVLYHILSQHMHIVDNTLDNTVRSTPKYLSSFFKYCLLKSDFKLSSIIKFIYLTVLSYRTVQLYSMIFLTVLRVPCTVHCTVQ